MSQVAKLYRALATYTEASNQNMTWEDMATRHQVMKDRTMESSNLLHEDCIVPLQYFKSLAYKTAIPAEEHAAASDRVAVTCITSVILNLKSI